MAGNNNNRKFGVTAEELKQLSKLEGDKVAEALVERGGVESSVTELRSFARDGPTGEEGREVKLNKAEHAWKPTVKDPAKEEMLDEKGLLKKNVLAILNKLTPQKFDALVKKFNALPIDSQCVELIFKKAVDEPGFSVAYAYMCQVLQMKKVLTDDSETETVHFRKLLISRCQKEFEKDYMGSLDRDKYRQDMAAASSEEERKQIKAVFEQMEMKLRQRSLGNIRFIGELYKLQMLTARIIHECVIKLLKTTNEESLECLCRLLTTVGQDLDVDTQKQLAEGPIRGLNNLAVYLMEMSKIIRDTKVCSRVRFLMQGVVELWRAGWKPRREVPEPKKIEEKDLIPGDVTADVVVICGEDAHRLHSDLIASKAVFFKVALSTPMVERVESKIQIKGVEPEIFKKVVKFMYEHDLEFDHEIELEDVLDAADRFDFDELKTEVNKIVKDTLGQDNMLAIAILAELFNATELLASCVKTMARLDVKLNAKYVKESPRVVLALLDHCREETRKKDEELMILREWRWSGGHGGGEH